MANTATGIILIAGTMTFTNEWYQGGTPNWRVPVATLLAAAVFDGLAHIDSKAATGLSIMVLLGAFVTPFNGKSIAETMAEVFSASTAKPVAKSKAKVG